MVYTAELKTIRAGERLPDVDVEVSTADRGIGTLKGVRSLLGEGRSILLGMPGAFTPTCSDLHLPGFYQRAAEFADLNAPPVVPRAFSGEWEATMDGWGSLLLTACTTVAEMLAIGKLATVFCAAIAHCLHHLI